jgi:hypothetical protein
VIIGEWIVRLNQLPSDIIIFESCSIVCTTSSMLSIRFSNTLNGFGCDVEDMKKLGRRSTLGSSRECEASETTTQPDEVPCFAGLCFRHCHAFKAPKSPRIHYGLQHEVIHLRWPDRGGITPSHPERALPNGHVRPSIGASAALVANWTKCLVHIVRPMPPLAL